MGTVASPDERAPAIGSRVGSYRWRICALLFAATTLNYVDRQVLGVLAPDLTKQFGWSEIDYSSIVTAFQTAYAIGLVSAGALIDRLGTRIGYALAICIWSLAAMSHALAGSAVGFAAARFMLGLGEAGNFPAAIKTVAEWFPRRERAFATGLFNSGSNVGAIVAPLAVPIIAVTWGWRAAFLFTGVLSAAWLITWLIVYRPAARHPRVTAAELAYISADQPENSGESTKRLPWARLLRHRQAWAFAVAKFMTDPIWWFFLFWLPKYLNSQYGLTLTQIGPPLIAIYLMADIGSIGGGWIAGRFIKRGWSVNKARKGAMLLCALAVVPIMFASQASSVWTAVVLIGLATAGHQGWSANLFTLASDMFPRQAVGSVVGLGGFAGAVGGMMISTFVGFLLEATHSYVPVFIMAGSAYLVALFIVHRLVPKLEPATMA